MVELWWIPGDPEARIVGPGGLLGQLDTHRHQFFSGQFHHAAFSMPIATIDLVIVSRTQEW